MTEPHDFVVVMLDGKPGTFWHSRWDGTKDPLPHQFVIDLGQEYAVGEVRYLARPDKSHGRIGEYRIYTGRVPFGGLFRGPGSSVFSLSPLSPLLRGSA